MYFCWSYRKMKVIPHSLTPSLPHFLTFSCNVLKYKMLLSDGSILNPHPILTLGGIPHFFELFLFKLNQAQWNYCSRRIKSEICLLRSKKWWFMPFCDGFVMVEINPSLYNKLLFSVLGSKVREWGLKQKRHLYGCPFQLYS